MSKSTLENLSGGVGVGSGLHKSTVLITAAELKDLVANPVELVQAPGVGKLIAVVNIVADYKYGTIPYAEGGDGITTFSDGEINFYKGLGVPPIANVGDALRGTGQSQIVRSSGSINAAQTISTRDIEDSALKLFGGDEDWLNGNGTLVVTTIYLIVDLH